MKKGIAGITRPPVLGKATVGEPATLIMMANAAGECPLDMRAVIFKGGKQSKEKKSAANGDWANMRFHPTWVDARTAHWHLAQTPKAAVTTEVFEWWMLEVALPALKKRGGPHVIYMDGCNVHKSGRVALELAESDVRLVVLPKNTCVAQFLLTDCGTSSSPLTGLFLPQHCMDPAVGPCCLWSLQEALSQPRVFVLPGRPPGGQVRHRPHA